ncbi:MAG: NRDE family protein [Deltaproteobacteria bacterium]|nr:NRDE family protein [Deltaproteobacteria bacterium]
MCTLAVYFQASVDFPLVIAANRDEFYDRPTAPPTLASHAPWIVAGRDLVAGGTWFGINENNLAAGILNRRSNKLPDPSRQSRGALCLDALRHSGVGEAIRWVCSQEANDYNPFNLLLASPWVAAVIGNLSGEMRATPLSPGLHLLSNLDLNDSECPRIAKSFRLFEALLPKLRADILPTLLDDLGSILSDHSTPLDPRSPGPSNNLCVHLDRFGTRSSSILAFSAATRRFRFWYADGAPCRARYREIALRLPPSPLSHC